MPKENCDSRVHLILVSHADSFGIPFESKGSFVINSFVISLCHHWINRPMASLYDLKSRKFHLVICQSVTIHCHPSIVHVIGPEALYFSCCEE